MSDFLLLILSVGVVLIVVLQIIVLLRKPKVELPAELLLRLEAVE